ncbi:hypothetical protein LCGC14_1818810 [marine sediment metagenome]|uniref:Ribosome recycling factor domain-containing protein n=1 Tax=marine sediment metagenome TaxID=412755 RepID=A0A0F9IZC9_9ZZZZ
MVFLLLNINKMKIKPINTKEGIKQRDKALSKLAQAKSRWSTRRYAQEYLGEFVDNLMQFFTEKLIKDCCTLQRKGKTEDTRVAIRNIRRDGNEEVKEAEKKDHISKDDSKKVLIDIQKITDEYIDELNKLMEIKETEIMEI